MLCTHMCTRYTLAVQSVFREDEGGQPPHVYLRVPVCVWRQGMCRSVCISVRVWVNWGNFTYMLKKLTWRRSWCVCVLRPRWRWQSVYAWRWDSSSVSGCVCTCVRVCVCVCVCVLPCRERFTYIVGYRGISMSYGWLSPSKWSRMGCRMSSHSFLYLV